MEDLKKKMLVGGVIGGVIGGALSMVRERFESSGSAFEIEDVSYRLPQTGHKAYVQFDRRTQTWIVEVDDGSRHGTMLVHFFSRPTKTTVESEYMKALEAGAKGGEYRVSHRRRR